MSNITILICDDDPVVHESLKIYLENEGYSCVSAFNGEDALEELKTLQPALMVLDIMMPKLNGLEVCKEVRKTSNMPIIMLTAKGEEIDRILGLELGADDYIVKPFSPREVVARIKAVRRRVMENGLPPSASAPGLYEHQRAGDGGPTGDRARAVDASSPLAATARRTGRPPHDVARVRRASPADAPRSGPGRGGARDGAPRGDPTAHQGIRVQARWR